MTLFIALILLYQFDYGWGWYVAVGVLYCLHLIVREESKK